MFGLKRSRLFVGTILASDNYLLKQAEDGRLFISNGRERITLADRQQDAARSLIDSGWDDPNLVLKFIWENAVLNRAEASADD